MTFTITGKMKKKYCYYKAPIGELLLVATEKGLEEVRFPSKQKKKRPDSDWTHDTPYLSEVMEQLTAYFAGQLKIFTLQLNPTGTPFQKKVWKELQKIPYGKTASYEDIAQGINSPKACRAVGGANGKNPIPIIIPCHRIIGKDGSLTGFGGGLDLKEYLLHHEQNTP